MRENSPIKKRILQIIDLKEITRYEFYKKSGIARGILDQNNGISEENISKFLEYMPDISTHWLLTGQGSMLNTSSTQINGSKNIVQSGGTENSAQIIGGRKNITNNKSSETSELQTLKQQFSFLEKENHLLTKENDLLKREIDLLKREQQSK
jgi:hypothetical protein